MAEINNRSAAEFAAGRKVLTDTASDRHVLVVEMPTTWSAANGDTVATGLVIPKGARLLSGVTVSNATGAASSTLSVGIRNNATKVAIDAAAIVNAVAITTAATAQVNTGAQLILGVRYVMPVDAEIYLTFGGANPTANQAIRIEVPYAF